MRHKVQVTYDEADGTVTLRHYCTGDGGHASTAHEEVPLTARTRDSLRETLSAVIDVNRDAMEAEAARGAALHALLAREVDDDGNRVHAVRMAGASTITAEEGRS